MHRSKSIFLVAIAFAATATFAQSATKSSPTNDALAINKAGIPLTQAVTLAEQHVHGKAARAEYENTKQGWAYDVEVVSGSKVFDVRIDAAKGQILSSTEDKADHDDHRDKRD